MVCTQPLLSDRLLSEPGGHCKAAVSMCHPKMTLVDCFPECPVHSHQVPCSLREPLPRQPEEDSFSSSSLTTIQDYLQAGSSGLQVLCTLRGYSSSELAVTGGPSRRTQVQGSSALGEQGCVGPILCICSTFENSRVLRSGREHGSSMDTVSKHNFGRGREHPSQSPPGL